MKKVLLSFIIVASAIVMLSCNDSDSPKSVTATSIECLQNGDYETYADLLLIEKDGKEVHDVDKQKIADILKAKASSAIESKGGIKSYEILDETIDEANGTATVKCKIVYGDGTSDESDTDLALNENKEWKLKVEK